MAHPTGPSKQAFLQKVKALVLAAYDGNLGANQDFVIQFSSNDIGDVSVRDHECEVPEFDDNTPLTKLNSDSA